MKRPLPTLPLAHATGFHPTSDQRTPPVPSRGGVLILTAGFGEGHNAAARALAAALDRAHGAGTARIVDAFALASPRFNRLARNIYLRLINDAPHLWSRAYDWIDRTDFVSHRLWLFRGERRVLRELLHRNPPVAIACTYPLYAFFLEQLARVTGPTAPVYNIVTDSISIHSLWWRVPCTGWFLPNEDSAAVLRRAGIPPGSIHVSGFPVPAIFGEQAATLTPPDLASGATPRVLHIINSGTRHAAETACRLLKETSWAVTCSVGRDDRLRQRLLRIARTRSAPTEILGWTDRIPHLMMTHHAIVSKAGGATTQESIAALCPMIVSQVVPGQEEGNYELLRRHGVGLLAESPGAVLAALHDAFADRGRLWREWRTKLHTLARPSAADAIAAHLLTGERSKPFSTPAPRAHAQSQNPLRGPLREERDH